MNIKQNNLTLRHAVLSDAAFLCAWWNDGRVMAHAGFHDGLNTTEEKIKEQISRDTDKNRRLIIEHDDKPIGEMSYRFVEDASAEIGIKICDETMQNKGLGPIYLKMLINYLFIELGCERIILDTNLNNTRAQHVYEKLGFTRLRVNENSWKDSRGEWQSSVDYEMRRG